MKAKTPDRKSSAVSGRGVTKMIPARIVHVITTLGNGGAESMLYKLLCETRRAGVFEQTVINLSGDDYYTPLIEELKIPVHNLDLKVQLTNIASLIRFWRILKKLKPHLMITWLYHSDFLGTLYAKAIGIDKLVWNIRCSNMDLGKYSILTKHLFSILSRMSHLPDVIIANSTAGKCYHERSGYTAKCWTVIPNGFDTYHFRPDMTARKQFRKELNIADDIPVVGMVARFDPAKDHALFFKTARIVYTAVPEVKFLLVGNGMDRDNQRICRMISDNGLENQTLLLGLRSGLNKIYNAMDLFVMTSAFGEGFPNVIGEAMSCGLPVVATDIGDCAYLVDGTGRIVPPGQPEIMASAWLDLLRLDVEEREKIKRSSRKRINDHFSINQVCEGYLSLFAQLIGRKR